MKKKSVVVCIILSLIILFLGSISYSSKIINPFVGLKGIIKIELSDDNIEKISDKPLIYIGKDYNDILNYMGSKGYISEQVGRGFYFQKDSDNILLVAEGFMQRYVIFSE
ncbi:hypothetical protein [Romboutsia sp.]|uniref:hypothetical protein n=1 Tax=Romboutsia sp. TaxID=1965302 RepID=UPI002CD63F14|nr:hypothetical protein [Romboutsia sp.]HSQ88922.1 hypothetical protein [Romboutsia sp.]